MQSSDSFVDLVTMGYSCLRQEHESNATTTMDVKRRGGVAWVERFPEASVVDLAFRSFSRLIRPRVR